MKALVINLRLNSLYSVRIPYTWQSALTYPLPPPSAVIGLLANILQRSRNDKPPLAYLQETEKHILWAGARLLSPAVVRSYTMSAITKWVLRPGGKATNVLGRQFAFARSLQLAAVCDDDFANSLANAIFSAAITCGDSESAATIEQNGVVGARVLEFRPGDVVETGFPFPVDLTKLSATGGRIYLTHSRCLKSERGLPLENYFYPLVEEKGVLKPCMASVHFNAPARGYEITGVGKVIAEA